MNFISKKKLYLLLSSVILYLVFNFFTDNPSDNATKKSTDGTPMCVHYLDVGQGDSTFIELANGQTMLIDAANEWNADDIIAYIKNEGYSKIDYVVATHPHSDHIGAMPDILNEFEIGNVYLPDTTHTLRVFEDMLDIMYEKGINTVKAEAGVTIFEDDFTGIEILSPVSKDYDDLNDWSAAVKITYGKRTFLFMGDAGKIVENEIMQTGADVKADVLKCGHHGSSTSSGKRFLKEVSPEFAVISCGEDNYYGHPHDETLDILNSVGAKILRTDTDGTVIITTDGNDIFTQP